jgi:catechol 1,2-dioxygenase
MNKHSRRAFLHRGAWAIGGGLLAGRAMAGGHSCKPTPSEVLGPFYRFNAPFQARLAGPEEPGQRLMLSGRVLGADCRTPLPGTLIEVWQANHAGLYDTATPGNFTDQHEFHLRGMLRTDEHGRYEIETVVPGKYPIPPGLPGLEQYAGLTRAAHIHFRVMHGIHVPLTTQLYFQGDPHLETDPWGRVKPSLAIALAPDGDIRRGSFDFVLDNGLPTA